MWVLCAQYKLYAPHTYISLYTHNYNQIYFVYLSQLLVMFYDLKARTYASNDCQPLTQSITPHDINNNNMVLNTHMQSSCHTQSKTYKVHEIHGTCPQNNASQDSSNAKYIIITLSHTTTIVPPICSPKQANVMECHLYRYRKTSVIKQVSLSA